MRRGIGLGPKRLRDVTYSNEFEALVVLEELVNRIVDEEFNGNPEMKQYLIKRFEGAREVLRREAEDYFTSHELRSSVPSSKSLRRKGSKYAKMKTLEGEEIIVRLGEEDWDDFYSVKVSRHRLKCTCPDAVMLSSVADKRFNMWLKRVKLKRESPEPIFYRYVICKHTLAKLAKAMTGSSGISFVNIDRELVETIKIGLYAVYLRVAKEVDPSMIRKIYTILKRAVYQL